MNNSENQRDYFRINDRVAMSIKALDDEELINANMLYEQRRKDFGVVNEFLLARERYLPKLIRIRQRDPDIAEYISYLEDKIQRLAATMGRKKEHRATKPTHNVNLSATGIRYFSDTPPETGSKVEITITLFPSGSPIFVFGDIIRTDIESINGKTVWSCVINFSHIHDEDMEALVKHVHARQLDELKIKAH